MKKHLLFVPILASLVLAGCGEQPTPPGPTPDPDPVIVNPTGITLSASSLSLIEGESETITVTVSPDDATDKTVTWSVSEGSDFVTVTDGVITAIKVGSAVVTAKTVNDISATCSVTVTSSAVDPTEVSISLSEFDISVGSTQQLSATVLPENATDKSVTWSISQGDAVSVSETGLVTALKAGGAVVQVKTVNNLVARCNVRVSDVVIEPTGVTLSDSQVNLVNGSSKQLVATVAPEDATDKSVIWSVTSGDAVTVDASGKVSAIKVGDAVVTVSTVNGKTASCNFSVVQQEVLPTGVTLNDHSLSITNGSSVTLNYTVAPDEATDKSVTWAVTSGDAVTVDASGKVSAVKVGDAVVTVSTVNGFADSCNFSVVPQEIPVESVSLSTNSLSLPFGGSARLTFTIAPSTATVKSVTWSVIEGNDVVSVSDGVVTAIKDGSAKVQVSTSNGKTDVCVVTVAKRSIKAYLNNDIHSLIDGNPFESVDGGEYVEVINKVWEDNVYVYTFTFGSKVKFNLKQNGYYVPTGLKINGDTYGMSGNSVIFDAVVEDPDDETSNFFDIEVLFKDTTPKIGDYEIVATESSHISLVFTYADNEQETKGCSQGDKIIITPKASDPDYEVKTITGYTYTTDDTIKHKSYFDITKVGDGTFSFVTPFSHDSCKTIWIEITEVNSSLFKDSELVGDYAVVRTYGLSESSSYIDKFEELATISFLSSGEIDYKSEVAYASKAENGVINAQFTTSNIELYYGKNVIVLGQSSSGLNMITPFSQSSNDIAIGIKMMPGMLLKDVVLDNFAFKLGDDIYGVFNFYYNNELYASLVADVTRKTITTDTTVTQYLGDKLASDQTVFEVFDKDNNSIMHVGYKNEGGKGNYVEITSRENGYTDADHSLVFINDNEALFDDETYKVSDVDANKITLACPTHEYDITLNPSSHTFVITGDRVITPKTLDIVGKTFTATVYNSWDEKYCDCEVVFSGTNDNISGVIRYDLKAQNVFYWSFTAVFDSATNMLTITVTDRGYNGATCNFDNSIGRTARILVEDGQITFKDQVSTQSNVYDLKNKTFVCDDFHF
ncbi:MAG: Ig-like domain-containing protein [Bacilli bacterium]|nr:Ig-like domain-containing protein [Bacilli bacterium]